MLTYSGLPDAGNCVGGMLYDRLRVCDAQTWNDARCDESGRVEQEVGGTLRLLGFSVRLRSGIKLCTRAPLIGVRHSPWRLRCWISRLTQFGIADSTCARGSRRLKEDAGHAGNGGDGGCQTETNATLPDELILSSGFMLTAHLSTAS
jgi:hypothetical protein